MANIESVDKYKRDVSAYVVERPRYQMLAKIVYRVLKRAAKDMGIEAIIQVRTKELASFAEKTIRKQANYPDPVNMMTDLCGARVITESTNEIAVVCEFIRRHFEVDEANTEDTVVRLKISEFGYRSVHFIVSLKPGEFLSDVAEVVAEDSGAESVVPYLYKRRTVDECIGKPYGPGPRYRMEIQVRSLLQHAWANLYHDRVYKSEFKVPSDLQRELTRIAAILEDADENFARAICTVDGYREYYGTYMPRERLSEEIDKQKKVREYDPGNRKLALKTARLAVVLERWDDVIRTLSDFVTRWQGSLLATKTDGVDLAAALDDALESRATAKTPAELRRAQQALVPMRDTASAALLLDYGTAKWHLGEKETARLCLNRAIGLDLAGADALIVLADTYVDEDESVEAMRLYTKAFAVNPMEPRALRGFLQLTAVEERNLDFVEPMRPTLKQVIQRCRERIRLGIYLPWAHYDIGFFSLLLGESYEAIGAYARAVELSHSESPVEAALERVQGLVQALRRTSHVEWSWLERFLYLAGVSKLDRLVRDAETAADAKQRKLNKLRDRQAEEGSAKGTDPSSQISDLHQQVEATRTALEKSLEELKSLREKAVAARAEAIERVSNKQCPAISHRVVVVVGGCAEEEEQRMREYGSLLGTVFRDFSGTLFSGGTRSGISELVGDLPAPLRGRIRKIACLPESLPTRHERHPDYEYYMHDSQGFQGFSPLGAIQVWADILSAGIDPSGVRVLGINGGKYAGLEYRLALMMGAKVGILRGSGRAADTLLEDPDWKDHPNLISLLYDPQTIRVFASGFSSEGIFDDARRTEVARLEHQRNVEKRKRESARDDRPENLSWDKLRPDLKRTILERVDFIVERLRVVDLRVVKRDEVPKGISPVVELEPAQIEIMAEMEHGRWNLNRINEGWRWGEHKDPTLRTHPCLVPWSALPEEEREKDRHYAREIPVVLEELGYAVVPAEPGE